MPQAQLLLVSTFLGIAIIAVILMATGRLPGPAKAVDAWAVARPTIPRQWLEVAFWGSIALPIASSGLLIGTIQRALPAVWNDVGQALIWLAVGLDAAISRRWVWLAIAAAFLAYSGSEVVTRL